MKIAVVGSRGFDDYQLLEEALNNIVADVKDKGHASVTLISGGAPGADSLAEMYARQNNIEIIVHEANWDDLTQPDARVRVNNWGKKYDANAGHRRNTRIVAEADLVVAFHNGSPGTADTLRKARAAGKEVVEFTYQ